MSSLRVAPSLALCAYAETWISGAKVVVFGDALSPLAERLVERGARAVQVYDRDAARVAEADAAEHARQISYAPLEGAGSVARDGLFDFGIIEELTTPNEDAQACLEALRRSLGRRGMALVAARNPAIARSLVPASGPSESQEPLGYYELYELVSKHFEEVRMLGQTAFVGYAVADFAAPEEVDVRLDTSFVPGGAEEPEWFLALVSSLPASPEAFSVIQLPLGDLPIGGDREEMERLERALERAEAELAERQRSKAAILKEAREAPQQRAQVEALQAELAKREQWLAGLESRAATADQRADEMQAELDQLATTGTKSKEELARLQRRLEDETRAKRALEEKHVSLEREVERLQKKAEDQSRRAVELDEKARGLAQRVDELSRERDAAERARNELLGAYSEEARAELRELEAQLVERGSEVARLGQALEQTERFGRQLISKVNELEAKAARAPGTPELERLARRNAELEADLEAARWTISSLGANLANAGGNPSKLVAVQLGSDANTPSGNIAGTNVPGPNAAGPATPPGEVRRDDHSATEAAGAGEG
jgi:hypothetical protein